jgi:hypothetical protein
MPRTRYITGALLGLLLATGTGSGSAAAAGLAPSVRDNLPEARAHGLFRPPAELRVAPSLAELADASPDREFLVWVFLTDKGIGTAAAFEEALTAAGNRLDERTRRRREATGAGLGLDLTDLPVYGPYVEALAEGGLAVRRASRWMNAVSGTISSPRLRELMRLPFVRYVQPVLVKRGGREPLAPPPATREERDPREVPARSWGGEGASSDSLEGLFYGASFDQLDQIGVLDLHRLGYTGAGVRVLVLDTGFRKEHPAFDRAHLVGEWDFVNEDGETRNEAGDATNQDYHGTGVWGTLGGYDPGDLIGPAFGAEFLLAKTEDITQEVRAEEDNYVAALEWADTMGVDVTSASLSYFGFDDSSGYTYQDLDGETAVITRAVDIAAAKGICCVNAIGNEGPSAGSLSSPADADSVLAVGAVDDAGTVAAFSSRGPTADNRIKPEVVARGVSTWWARAWTLGYGSASGTSLAAPLVGGLAALLKEGHPEWTGPEIRAALLATAGQALSPDNQTGYGLASGPDALEEGALPPSPPRTSLPFRLLDPPHGVTGVSQQPMLRWEASAPPAPGVVPLYHLLVAEDSLFSAPDTFVVSDTTFTFPTALPAGSERWWTVEAIVPAGYVRRSWNACSFTPAVPVAVGPEPVPLPAVALGPAVPNPARGAVRFSFRLPAGAKGRAEVVAVSGRLVRRYDLVGTGEAGDLVWDGRDGTGRPLPAGIYFVRLAGAGMQVTRKLVRVE